MLLTEELALYLYLTLTLTTYSRKYESAKVNLIQGVNCETFTHGTFANYTLVTFTFYTQPSFSAFEHAKNGLEMCVFRSKWEFDGAMLVSELDIVIRLASNLF